MKICWNSNQTDLLDGGFEANFKLLKDQIGQIHMRDLYLEEYPFRALITHLAAMNFQGYCFAEIPESTDGVRVLRYFKGLFRAYQNLNRPSTMLGATLSRVEGSRACRAVALAEAGSRLQRICLARSLMEKTRLARGPVFSSEGSATSMVSSGFNCSVDLNHLVDW